MAHSLSPSRPASAAGSQRRSRSATTRALQQEEPLRAKNFVGAALPSQEYLRWFMSKARYRELLLFSAHLADHLAKVESAAGFDWPEVSAYMAQRFGYLSKRSDHPMLMLLQEDGENLKQLYDEMCGGELRAQADSLLVHREFLKASFARRIAMAAAVRSSEWQRQEDTDGGRLKLHGFRDSFRKAEMEGRHSVDLDNVVKECSAYLVDYIQQGIHIRFPDIARSYIFHYFHEVYRKFGYDFPISDDVTVKQTAPVPTPPATTEEFQPDDMETQDEPPIGTEIPVDEDEMLPQKDEVMQDAPDEAVPEIGQSSAPESMDTDQSDLPQLDSSGGEEVFAGAPSPHKTASVPDEPPVQEEISPATAVQQLLPGPFAATWPDDNVPEPATPGEVPSVEHNPPTTSPQIRGASQSPRRAELPHLAAESRVDVVPKASESPRRAEMVSLRTSVSPRRPELSQKIPETPRSPDVAPGASVSPPRPEPPRESFSLPRASTVSTLTVHMMSPEAEPTSREIPSPTLLPNSPVTVMITGKSSVPSRKGVTFVPSQPSKKPKGTAEKKLKVEFRPTPSHAPVDVDTVKEPVPEMKPVTVAPPAVLEEMDLPIEKVITKVDEAALQPAVDRAMAFVEREKQRLVDGVLPLTLRGLVGSMQKAERTDLVDYEPFKMPVDDKEYRGKVFRQQSLHSLVRQLLLKSPDSSRKAVRELPLVALNAVAYNASGAEVTNMALRMHYNCKTLNTKMTSGKQEFADSDAVLASMGRHRAEIYGRVNRRDGRTLCLTSPREDYVELSEAHRGQRGHRQKTAAAASRAATRQAAAVPSLPPPASPVPVSTTSSTPAGLATRTTRAAKSSTTGPATLAKNPKKKT